MDPTIAICLPAEFCSRLNPAHSAGHHDPEGMAKAYRQTLIQQDLQAILARRESFASSKLHRHLVGNSWKLPQELAKRMATLQKIYQILERNPGAAEAWHSTHDFRIAHDDGFEPAQFTRRVNAIL